MEFIHRLFSFLGLHGVSRGLNASKPFSLPRPPIRKAIIPVAGLGTRFLPATKSIPKEMLTVVDRPAVEYVVEEARSAGIQLIIFVTGRNKGAIEDYFDQSFELERTLEDSGKTALLANIQDARPETGSVVFTRQNQALGLGHAIWAARHLINGEPFAVLLPDMLHKGQERCLESMVDAYNEYGGNILSVYEVPDDETHLYGICGVGAPLSGKVSSSVFPITQMIEKPEAGTAPSRYAISGRYILQPEIFTILSSHKKGAGNEIQLTDAIIELAKTKPCFANLFLGKVYDCGTKIGFLKANVAYALSHSDLNKEFRQFTEQALKEMK